MDVLRRYVWLWTVAGVALLSFIIVVIFFFINRCLSRAGSHKVSQLQKKSDFKVESNKYQARNANAETPPLPPRTQFSPADSQSYENLTETQNSEPVRNLQPDYLKVQEQLLPPPPPYDNPSPGPASALLATQSYENLAEDHDYEEATPDYEEATPDYEEATPDYEEASADYEEASPDYEEATPDYEEASPDYEEATPDYEEASPDYEEASPDYEQSVDDQPDYVKVENEVNSEEDYDDIGEDDGEEDYDDVG